MGSAHSSGNLFPSPISTPVPVVESPASYCGSLLALAGHSVGWGPFKIFQHIFRSVHKAHEDSCIHAPPHGKHVPLLLLSLPALLGSLRQTSAFRNGCSIQLLCLHSTDMLWSPFNYYVLKSSRTCVRLSSDRKSQVIFSLGNSLQWTPFGNFKIQAPKSRSRILSELKAPFMFLSSLSSLD